MATQPAIYYNAALDILRALGATPGPANVNMLVAWMPFEYGASFLAVTNNPLATGRVTTGALGYCMLPNGLRSSEPCYDTLPHGAEACALTLRNGLYPHLLSGLVHGDVATFFGSAAAAELQVWNGHGYTLTEVFDHYTALPTVPSQYLPHASSGGSGGSCNGGSTGTPNPGAPATSPGINPWIAGAGVAVLLLVGGLPGLLVARSKR